MPLTVPRSVARFNRRVTNPLQLRFAWLLPPWAVICHRGRRTGRLYRTPVNAYRSGNTLAVVVLYGRESDWVRNVLAGGARVVRAGRTYDLLEPRVIDPRVVDAGVAPVPVPVPRPARLLGRLTGAVLVARLGPAHRGFGPDQRPVQGPVSKKPPIPRAS